MSFSASAPAPRPRYPAQPGARLDISRTLAPARRAIGLTRLARLALLGLTSGMALGILIAIAGHLRGSSALLSGAVVVTVAGALAGAVAGVIRWPGEQEAARAVDFHFDLNDRLTTALEFRSTDTPVAQLQGVEAARRVDGLALRQSRGPWLNRREGAVIVLAAIGLAGALLLGPTGSAHRTAAASSSDSRQARRAAAARVQQLITKVHLGLTPAQLHSLPLRRLDRNLANLRRQLLHASTPQKALRAISTTQQQLRRLALGLHPINTRAVAQLNSSLNSARPGTKSGAGAKATLRSAAATAQLLTRLAQSLAHLTPAQRAALARALAKAANANSSNQLRASLRQAASSLANGDPRAAAAALQQASQALSQSPASQASLSRLTTTGNQLDLLKNQLSGANRTLPAVPTGKSGAGLGRPGIGRRGAARPGLGARPGKGRGAGQGKGPARIGRGQGKGRGAGVGKGAAVQTGQGTAGGLGRGGKGRANPTRGGRNTTVFIPGQQGKGPDTVRNGPNGAAEPGAIVPYHQVLGRYSQSAHQALDRAALPPALQATIRRYFNTLSR